MKQILLFPINLVAYIGVLILQLIATIITWVIILFKYKSVKGYFLQKELSIDIAANYEYRALWNIIFIKKEHRSNIKDAFWLGRKEEVYLAFGEKNKSISYQFGKFEYYDVTKRLSKTGNFMRIFLNFIQKDHCINAFEKENKIIINQ